MPLRPDHLDGEPNLYDINYTQLRLPPFAFVPGCPHAAGVRILREQLLAKSQAFVHIPVMRSYSIQFLASMWIPPFGVGAFLCLLLSIRGSGRDVISELVVDAMLLLAALLHRSYYGSLLPQAQVVTLLDDYTMTTITFLLLMFTLHVIVHLVEPSLSDSVARMVDLASAGGSLLIWLLYSCFFALHCLRTKRVRHEEVAKQLRFYADQHGFEIEELEADDAPPPHRLFQLLRDEEEASGSLHGSPDHGYGGRSMPLDANDAPPPHRLFQLLRDEEEALNV